MYDERLYTDAEHTCIMRDRLARRKPLIRQVEQMGAHLSHRNRNALLKQMEELDKKIK